MTAVTLWIFLLGLISGKNKKQAWRDTNIPISDSFLYDLSNRLIMNQSHIRTKLHQTSFPFDLCQESVLHHLHSLNQPANPIATFQYSFQDHFLKH
jgi:hypothetical protein